MKYLFIVQGEGRGHLTQAITLENLLISRGHEVVGIYVGKSDGRKIPAFFLEKVKAPIHQFQSVNFVNSSDNMHPDLVKTVIYNILHIGRFFPSIRTLTKAIKESGADVVVNFYEGLGTVGYLLSGKACGKKKIPMVTLAHQYLFLHKDMKLPSKGYEGAFSMNLFSRFIAFGASKILALSFRKMPDSGNPRLKVVPPLLREEIRSLPVESGDYILGYIVNKGFAEEVRQWHREHPDVKLHFFWDNKEKGEIYKEDENLVFYYLNDKEFLRQMSGCKAYASTAGFESICEAMYFGKPLMMVPSHIEQKCNAFDATKYDAAVSAEKFNLSTLLDFANGKYKKDEDFRSWADSSREVFMEELDFFAKKCQ